jgi:hypothetical protein
MTFVYLLLYLTAELGTHNQNLHRQPIPTLNNRYSTIDTRQAARQQPTIYRTRAMTTHNSRTPTTGNAADNRQQKRVNPYCKSTTNKNERNIRLKNIYYSLRQAMPGSTQSQMIFLRDSFCQ